MQGRWKEFSGASAKKPTHASLIFPKLSMEIAKDVELAGNLRGLFILSIVTEHGLEEWYLLFRGMGLNPVISQTKPTLEQNAFPVVFIEMKDKDLLTFVMGGLSGIKAVADGKMKIVGDLVLAQAFEHVFVKAGGVQKTLAYMKERNKL